MRKIIYLSIGVASLTLVSFRQQDEKSSEKKINLKSEATQKVKFTDYVKFDHKDNSLVDPAKPPKE
ncbi:hypothetical protein [Halpernia sp. GG3]